MALSDRDAAAAAALPTPAAKLTGASEFSWQRDGSVLTAALGHWSDLTTASNHNLRLLTENRTVPPSTLQIFSVNLVR